jgi:hypothetical protein
MYSIDSCVLHLLLLPVAGVNRDKKLELGIGDSVDRLDFLSDQVRLTPSGRAKVILYQEPGNLRHFCRERMKRISEYFDTISCPLFPDEIAISYFPIHLRSNIYSIIPPGAFRSGLVQSTADYGVTTA